MVVLHPELVPSFTAKWALMQVTFQPQCLAASLRVRGVGAVALAEKSRVTCQVCGPLALERIPVERSSKCFALSAAQRLAVVASPLRHRVFSTGVLDFVKYARRIGDAFRQAIRGATRTGHRG